MRQRVSESASQQVSAAKWIGNWLLQIPVYLVTSYLIQTLLGSCYRLLLRAGAQLPPNFLLEHMLLISGVAGLLAGLIGLLLFRAMLFLPNRPQLSVGPMWKRPQAWTWVLAACWFLFGLMAWFGRHQVHSVLETSGGASFSNMIEAFFGNGCYLPRAFNDQWVLQTCMSQLTFTHPLLGTLGYSIAAFVPSQWRTRLRQSEPALIESDEVSAKIPKTDEQGQIAHS